MAEDAPPLIRADVKALFARWGEALLGGILTGFGLWLAHLGGLFFLPLGGALAALGVAWAVISVRRARFWHDPDAPGLVEIDEGRLRYLHPVMAGDISLDDLIEIRLITLRGRRVWRLKDLYGQALLVPVDAAGAPALFDAFAALPDLSSADLLAALAPERAAQTPPPSGATGLRLVQTTPLDRLVWRRRGRGMTRG